MRMSTALIGRSDLEFDLADRLHKSLRVSGKTGLQIAADLGAHRNTVANYLAGRSRPERPTLAGWALATGVPLTWLESGDSGPTGGGSAGPGAHVSRGSVGAIREAITQVLGVSVDMITFALIAEALGAHDAKTLGEHGFTSWIVATASGFDPDDLDVSRYVPAYIDKNGLANELHQAVEECTRRDSNPKPSDPKVRPFELLRTAA